MTRTLTQRLRPEFAALRAYTVPKTPPRIKLDANESPWPLPDAFRQALGTQLANIDLHRYPDGRATRLRSLLAARLGCPEDALIFGAGSDELIALLMSAFSHAPTTTTTTTTTTGAHSKATVVFPTPTFVMYHVTAQTLGLAPVGVPLSSDWHLDEAAMSDAITRSDANLVFYASPNNPTGNRFDDAVVRRLVEAHPHTLHVIDEAYGAFADVSCNDWCARYPNVAVLGTLSKIGFAAARVGWVCMPPTLAHEVDKARQPFNLNALSQCVGELVLGPWAPWVDQRVTKICDERARLFAALQQLHGFTPCVSDANFILLQCEHPASHIADALLRQSIGVRAFRDSKALQHHVRITVGTPDENNALLRALEAV